MRRKSFALAPTFKGLTSKPVQDRVPSTHHLFLCAEKNADHKDFPGPSPPVIRNAWGSPLWTPIAFIFAPVVLICTTFCIPHTSWKLKTQHPWNGDYYRWLVGGRNMSRRTVPMLHYEDQDGHSSSACSLEIHRSQFQGKRSDLTGGWRQISRQKHPARF